MPIATTWPQLDGSATFDWNEPPGGNVVFEMMIEGQIGPANTVPPTLTDVHGFIQHFGFGGCSLLHPRRYLRRRLTGDIRPVS